MFILFLATFAERPGSKRTLGREDLKEKEVSLAPLPFLLNMVAVLHFH